MAKDEVIRARISSELKERLIRCLDDDKKTISEFITEKVTKYIEEKEKEMTNMREISIPENVLEKIVTHRPHLAPIVKNLKRMDGTSYVPKLEKTIADAYLVGETKLTPMEALGLSKCCVGEPYKN